MSTHTRLHISSLSSYLLIHTLDHILLPPPSHPSIHPTIHPTMSNIVLLQLTIPKHKNDIMGLMVMESGYGSAIPACVIMNVSKTGAASRSGLLNVGDHILSINGINLVGMPRKTCIDQIKVCVNDLQIYCS